MSKPSATPVTTKTWQLKPLSAQQYHEFMAPRNFEQQGSFAQSVEFGQLRQKLGWSVFYLGVFAAGHSDKKGQPIGAMLAAKAPGRAARLDIFCGPVIDFQNMNLVAWLTTAIKRFAKQHDCLSVTINPLVIYLNRDQHGKPIDQPNQGPISHLQQVGWRWSGLTTKSGQPRFYYVRDLAPTYDETFKSFATSVRTNTRRARENGLTVRQLKRNELSIFKQILESTADRQGFQDKTMAYYEALFDAFGDQARFFVIELHPEQLRQNLTDKIDRLQNDLTKAKTDGQKKQIDLQIASVKKQLSQAKKLPRETAIPVCAGAFITSNGEVVYLFGGSLKEYMNYGAVYFMMEQAMRTAIKQGIFRYNFYGISGVFDPHDPTYGVLEFKQGFGGQIEELIGEFRLMVSPKFYFQQAGAAAKHVARNIAQRL
jgi:alanine adding enzyme